MVSKRNAKQIIYVTVISVLDLIFLPIGLFLSLISRLKAKTKTIVGMGPNINITFLGYKKALQFAGLDSEIVIRSKDRITEGFSSEIDYTYGNEALAFLIRDYLIFFRAIIKYKTIIINYGGYSLGNHPIGRYYESLLLNISKIGFIVIPQGSDVQRYYDSPNLIWRYSAYKYYDRERLLKKSLQIKQKMLAINKIKKSFIFGGRDWIDYMDYWDGLLVGESAPYLKNESNFNDRNKIRIFHSSNHKELKGSNLINSTIQQLIKEGFPIEYLLLFQTSHDEVIDGIKWSDIVIDNIVMGWYGYISIESLALGKPVGVFLRKDLVNLHNFENNLFNIDDSPFIDIEPTNLRNLLIDLIDNRDLIETKTSLVKSFYQRFYSLEALSEKLLVAVHHLDKL